MAAITSTSSVARVAGAAGSVSQRWMLAPPRKTTSPSSGPRALAAVSSSSSLTRPSAGVVCFG